MAVIAGSKCLALLTMTVVVLLAISGPAFSGDDDKAPAYMIYIDPETGKYTTTKPHSTGTADAAEQSARPPEAPAMSSVPPAASTRVTADAQPGPDMRRSNLPLLIASTSVLAVLVVIGVVRSQRKQLHSG
jgi:hypothetical protein